MTKRLKLLKKWAGANVVDLDCDFIIIEMFQHFLLALETTMTVISKCIYGENYDDYF